MTKNISIVFTILLFSFLFGCGGGGSDANSKSEASNTSPWVIAPFSPTNGETGVAVTKPVIVDFSHFMDPLTVNPVTFAVKDPANVTVAGAYGVVADKVTFTPTSNLAPLTKYTVALSGMKDTAGVVMPFVYGYTFTTAALDPTIPTQAEITAAGIRVVSWTDATKPHGYVERKAYWIGTKWERQVVVFNGDPTPALAHPVWLSALAMVLPDAAPAVGASKNFGIVPFYP